MLALSHATGRGGQVHVPAEAVLARFRKDYRGYASEGLDRLVRRPERYVLKHPTSGGMTYEITTAGMKTLRELRLL